MQATAKYKRALSMHVGGRLRYTMQFSGAGRTGRTAHKGFQPGNMPRAITYNPTHKKKNVLRSVTYCCQDDDVVVVGHEARHRRSQRLGVVTIHNDAGLLHSVEQYGIGIERCRRREIDRIRPGYRSRRCYFHYRPEIGHREEFWPATALVATENAARRDWPGWRRH